MSFFENKQLFNNFVCKIIKMLEELICLNSDNIILHFPFSWLLYIGIKSLVTQLCHILN
jgi:hypothetical protein